MGTFFAGMLTAVALGAPAPAAESTDRVPGGDRILLSSPRSGLADLFLVDPATGDTTNVTRTEREEELSPAWSPDGKRIAFASKAAGTGFEVFTCAADGSNRQRISSMPDRPCGATCPTWSADGKRVAYARGYPDNKFEVRVAEADGSSDEVIREDASHPAWSPDGETIAFVEYNDSGRQGLATMAPDGTGVKVLAADIGRGDMCHPAWSPDGKWIVYPAASDYGVQLFAIPAKGGAPRQLTHLAGFNLNPVWLSKDRLLFTHITKPGTPGGAYASMKIDGSRLSIHPLTKAESAHPLVRPAVYLPRDEMQASERGNPVRTVAFTTHAVEASTAVRVAPIFVAPPAAPGSIGAVAWSADGKRLALGLEVGHVLVAEFDGKAVRPLEVFRGHKGPVDAVAFSADGGLAYSAGADASIRTWDIDAKDGKAKELNGDGWVFGLAASASGHLLATGDINGGLKIRDAATGKVIREMTSCDPKRGAVHTVAFGKDDEVVFAGCARWDVPVLNGAVSAYDPATGKLIWRTKGTFGGVFAMAVSPDGTKVAGACLDSYIRIWDAATGKETSCWKGHTDRATGVAWGLGGRVVVSCGFDHTVRIWDAASGSQLHTLAAHAGPAIRAAASPEGNHVVTAGQDGALIVWRLSE